MKGVVMEVVSTSRFLMTFPHERRAYFHNICFHLNSHFCFKKPFHVAYQDEGDCYAMMIYPHKCGTEVPSDVLAKIKNFLNSVK